MKIKKNDNIIVITGKDKGKSGKVIKALPKDDKILVEAVSMRKRHMRPRKQGEKGQIVSLPTPIHISNVMLVCPKCSKPTRVGYKVTDSSKSRVCKKCSEVI